MTVLPNRPMELAEVPRLIWLYNAHWLSQSALYVSFCVPWLTKRTEVEAKMQTRSTQRDRWVKAKLVTHRTKAKDCIHLFEDESHVWHTELKLKLLRKDSLTRLWYNCIHEFRIIPFNPMANRLLSPISCSIVSAHRSMTKEKNQTHAPSYQQKVYHPSTAHGGHKSPLITCHYRSASVQSITRLLKEALNQVLINPRYATARTYILYTYTGRFLARCRSARGDKEEKPIDVSSRLRGAWAPYLETRRGEKTARARSRAV